MIGLKDYILINRENVPPPTLEYGWYGEMYTNIDALFYDVPTIAENKKVFTFIAYPRTKKPKEGYPALLLIHGGNGGAFYEMAHYWANKGFVVISPDFNGKYAYSINDRQKHNALGGNEGYGSIKDLHQKDTWAYFSVLSAMRAIDILVNDSEVDINNIFSCGLSWGGVIQLLLASVDKRIKGASVIYSSAYILDSEWGQKATASLSDSDKQIWDNFIDPKNYISDIVCPVFFTAGTDDVAFKMENRRHTANNIKTPVYFGLRRTFPHGNFIGFEQKESEIFFKAMIDNLPIVQPRVSVCNEKLVVKKNFSDSKLYFVYTFDDIVKTEKQEWIEKSINENTDIIIEKKIKAFFVVEKLIDGTQWSTNVITL